MAEGDTLPDPPDSPIARGRVIADRWTVGARVEVRGDLHVHRGAAEQANVHLAVFRYRGTMPLPRFLRQLQTARDQWVHLRHGNLVTTLDGGRVTGETTCFWVQEDPGAAPLGRRLFEHPRLATEVALHIALQVSLGLRAIHEVGAVHGDLDPANIGLLGSNDRVRLGWPALAPMLELAGLDAGRGTTRSLTEVAPEVLAGNAPDAASDRYALGALLYRMLMGEPPFLVRRGEGLPGIDDEIELPPLPDETPKRVVELVERLLERDPGRRPDETAAVVEELAEVEGAARGRPVPAGAWAPTPGPPPERELTSPVGVQRTLTPALRRGEEDAALVTPTPPGSALTRTPPSMMPRPGRSRGGPDVRVWMLAGAVALLTVVLFVVWGTLWMSGPPAAEVATDAVSPPGDVTITRSPDPAMQVPPPAVPSGPAVLTLRTDPPGAVVWEGDVNLGVTPLEIVLEGGPADPPRSLMLRRPGFAPHTVKQSWTTQDVQHTVPLQRLPAPPDQPPKDLPEIREER